MDVIPGKTTSADEPLRRLARARSVSSACHRALMQAASEPDLLRDTCRIAVNNGGYCAAWIGLVLHDARCTIEPVASAGDHDGNFATVRSSWADNEFGRGPAGLAVRLQQPQIIRDTRSDVRFARWRELALARGYESACAFPLICAGEVLGVLSIFAAERQCFDDEEVQLLGELAEDIAFGLQSVRSRQLQRHADLRLAKLGRAQFVMTECNRTLARSSDERQLYQDICEILAGPAGYVGGWIGMVEYDAQKTIRPVASAGMARDYVAQARIGWGLDEMGQAPAGRAVRTGAAQLVRNIEADASYGPWRDRAIRRHVKAAIVLPLKEAGRVIGVLALLSAESGAFDEDEGELLHRLAGDIAHGVSALRSREARRVAEKRVAESEQRFRAVFDLAPVGINHVAPDGQILLANPFFERLLGYERGELPGRNIRDFSLPEDADALKELLSMREQLHAGLTDNFSRRHRYRRKDGSVVWVGLNVAAIRDSAGNVLYDISAVEDISERVRAERLQALEHAIVRCLAQGEGAMGGVTEVLRAFCEADEWDCGRYFHADEGNLRLAAQWYGSHESLRQLIAASAGLVLSEGRGLIGDTWRSGEPVWCTDATVDPRVHPRSVARLAGMRGIFAFPVFAGETMLGVASLGSFIPKAPDERLLRAAKSIGSLIGQFLQRKSAEEGLRRFRAAMDFSIDSITLVDRASMRIIDANKTAYEQLGVTREELLEMPPYEIAGRGREEQAAIYDKLIAGRGETGPVIGMRRRRDGSAFPVEVYRHAVPAGEGHLIVVLVRDITERRRNERLRNVEHLVARGLAEADDASAALKSVMQALCESEHWECGRYFRVDESAGVLRFAEFWLSPGSGLERFVDGAIDLVFAPGAGIAGRSWLSGQPVWVSDLELDGRALRPALAASFGIRGVLTFPITTEGRTLGVLVFNSRYIRAPDEELMSAIRAIGSQIGQFLQRKLAEEARQAAEQRMRVQAHRQHVIAEFSQDTLANTELVPILKQGVDLLVETLGVDCCDVTRFDPDHQRLTVLAAAGWSVDWPGYKGVQLTSGGPMEDVLARREPLIIGSYEDDPAFASSLPAQWGICSGMMMPISAPSESFVLCAHSKRQRSFGEEEASFVRSIANVLAVAIERTRAADRLAYLAQFDSLTALPNRHLFHDRLVQSLAQAKRIGTLMAVLFIDLDRFKLVNDTLGHAKGDLLLKEAATRLQQCVRASDTVGRLGGDEFSAILLDLSRPGDAGLVAQKIIDTLAQPFNVSDHEVFVSASIGITLFPSDGDDASALVVNADAAMYRAKEQGRNNYQFFTREMNMRALERVQLESQLRRALERNEYLLHYQPRVDLQTGMICGLEALLRWQHPDRGLVSPVEFIPVLEDTNLILPVGEWVLNEVCGQIRRWLDQGMQVPPIAVNLSVRQFQQKGLQAGVLRLLKKARLPTASLQFEITESLLMSDPAGAERALRRLSEAGVKLSVDDFGTGYSSLAYLKRFPLDSLKIDRAFVRDLTSDPEDAAITLAIINLAHSLDLRVVAEGVETESQLAFLRHHGCDEIQGFYFSRALPPAQCAELLRTGRKLEPQPRRAPARKVRARSTRQAVSGRTPNDV